MTKIVVHRGGALPGMSETPPVAACSRRRTPRHGRTAVMTAVYAVGASLPLLLGVWWRPSRRLLATALAYAAGALIASMSFELFQESFAQGAPIRQSASHALPSRPTGRQRRAA